MREKLLTFRWVLARLAFMTYIVFSTLTIIGGYLTAPLMTWYFFGDWRFWRHWHAGIGLLPHGLRMTAVMFNHRRTFLFSVPLASPPRSIPDPSSALCRTDWQHGNSCGDCTNCCKADGNVCPLLDQEQQTCRGYNSFYWRYFNCGRYPSYQEEIHYYDCRKWALTSFGQAERASPIPNPALSVTVAAVQQEECL